MHADRAAPGDGGPHAMAQLALWLIRLLRVSDQNVKT